MAGDSRGYGEIVWSAQGRVRAVLIESRDLKLLLESRKGHIGGSLRAELLNTAGAVGLLASAYQLDDGALRLALLAYGSGLLLLNLWGVHKTLRDKYTHEELLKEVQSLDLTPRKYSLVAIKDTFRKYPNRFLLYYDKGWECPFLLNYKTRSSGNEEAILEALSHELKVSVSEISMKRLSRQTYQKFSSEDGVEKNYEHSLYLVEIANFPEALKADSFSIDGKDFIWMSVEDMKRDPRIQEKNLDVVSLLRENIT